MDQAIQPAVLRRRLRVRLITGIGLMLAFCATAWAFSRAISPSVSLADVRVAQVRRGSIANTINASGLVVPVHEELVPSPIQTRVSKIIARAGQQVASGELLLELDASTVKLAIDALSEQLAQQENRIVGLTLEMEQKRKQLTSGIELLELDLRSAKVKWERFQKLRGFGAVSGEDMLTAELNVQRIDIQLRQQRELIGDNDRSTNSAIEGARLQKTILQKQVAQQQQLLAQTQVRAPFAGMLTWLATEEGASVAPGQLVARVSELNNYRVEASVSDFHARSLTPGQAVHVEQGSAVLSGHVQTVLPEIQNGSVKLLVALDQPNHPVLRNKLRVDVNIVTDQKADALIVDTGPAFNGRGRQNAFVLGNGIARKTVLDLGSADGKAVEIVSGAKPGDRIIVSDISRYKDLDSVRITR